MKKYMIERDIPGVGALSADELKGAAATSNTALCQLGRYFRAHGGRVISVTRHTSNALRAHADVSLLVSAHDDRAHIEPLLYHSALQHLLDGLFVMLCEADPGRYARLHALQTVPREAAA